MPIINPESFEGLWPLATLDGGSSLVCEGTLSTGLRALLAGASSLIASGVVAGALAANLDSASSLTATGRLNDEANVFGAALLEGMSALEVSGGSTLGSVVRLDGASSVKATGAVASAPETSFAFIVDVRSAAVTTALSQNIRRFAARLIINRVRDDEGEVISEGVTIPVKNAKVKAPPDTLGTELSVELARADVSQIPLTASVDFDFGVWTGSAFVYQTIMQGAKLSGRSKRVVNSGVLPSDTVSVTFVDVVADRWNLAPQGVNLFYYDPDKVKPPAAPVASGFSAIPRSASGVEVLTISTASPGLDLYSALALAYVTGCGFAAVKTNIPTFPIESVNFTLTGGYDAGVRGLLKPFAPVVFPVGNVLWIVDPDSPLPAGLAPKPLTVNKLTEITSTFPAREPVDGILVTIKATAATGEYYTERIETEHSETGDFGTSGFTSTDTERRVREYRLPAAPTVIRREVVAYLKTTVEDFEGNMISRETQTDNFDSLGRKVGHLKTNEQRLPFVTIISGTPHVDMLLQTASTETQAIFYGAHPLKPNIDTILKIETRLEGLILVDSDNKYLDKPFKMPLTDAHRTGAIDKDANQTTELGSIKTTFEYLRVRGDSVEMETRVINHISNAPDSSKTTTRPGADELDRTSQATEQILLTLPGVRQKRRVADFDGSNLPSDIALASGLRQLYKLMNPPLEFAGDLAYPDTSLRRGVILEISERGGAALGGYIATGYEMSFELKAAALEVIFNLTARLLTTTTLVPFR